MYIQNRGLRQCVFFVESCPGSKRHRKAWSARDYDKLIACADPDTAVENYLTVLKETGAGLQEVNLLAWQDVDFKGL